MEDHPVIQELLRTYGRPEAVPLSILTKKRVTRVLSTEDTFYLCMAGRIEGKRAGIAEERPVPKPATEESSLADMIQDLPPESLLGEIKKK